MKQHVSLVHALRDPQLLGAGLGPISSWRTWLVALKAVWGERLSKSERETFGQLAGDRQPPATRVRETWILAGRRSGKSRMAAAIGVFIATMTDATTKLTKGEVGHVPIISPSLAQSKTVLSTARDFSKARQSSLLRSKASRRARSGCAAISS